MTTTNEQAQNNITYTTSDKIMPVFLEKNYTGSAGMWFGLHNSKVLHRHLGCSVTFTSTLVSSFIAYDRLSSHPSLSRACAPSLSQ